MADALNVRTIVVDLDKTLLRADKTISPYTEMILKECKKRAMRIMAATARPLRDVTQYCRIVDFDALVVSNGARVICGNQRQEHGISQKSAGQLLKALQRHPELRVTLETGDCAYANKPIAEYETVLCGDLERIAQTEGVLKILVHLDGEETLATVERSMAEDLYYTIANGYLMQIMSMSATKWNGIKAMLDTCGCSALETAYFGDDFDDIEPIQKCGIGIAVANGIPEAKAAADYVAESNDADGVARFIEQRIFGER